MKSRSYLPAALNHCYQRTSGHGVLFYTVHDHLVFFSIFCTMARRHQVHVLKLVQMPDHTHHSTFAPTRDQLRAFQRDYTSAFAKEYNRTFRLSGPVFETPFSYAQKRSDKDIRSNLLYLDNNPVERKIVKQAEEYRWNYLAYAQSDHPFSEKVRLRYASMPLRRALERVRYLRSKDRYLTYPLLKKMFDSLPSKLEKEQLTDFIICTYSVIDHAAAVRYFGGYEAELISAHSTTGSEYDITEGFIGKSDAHYKELATLALKDNKYKDIHDILSLTEKEKYRLLDTLKRKSDVPEKQIRAFLHLSVEVNT